MFSSKPLMFAAFSLSLGASLLAPSAQAQTGWSYGPDAAAPSLDEKYLTVDHVEFEELASPSDAPGHSNPMNPANPMNPQKPSGPHLPSFGSGDDSGDPFGSAIGDISSIINIGEKLWQIVSANQPVVTTSQNAATAVPDGIKNWTQLAGWQNPQVRNYKASFKNAYGMTVVNFGYQLQFNSGGNLNGVGHFLSNATIRATQVDVVWGYKFSADATVGDVVNVGSSQDPIAGVNLTLTWKVGTVIKQDNNSRTFFVRGDGQVEDLSQ